MRRWVDGRRDEGEIRAPEAPPLPEHLGEGEGTSVLEGAERARRHGHRVRGRPGPWPRRKPRTVVREGTGQVLYPAIEFENGTWYREQSSEMEQVIREGRLMEKAGG